MSRVNSSSLRMPICLGSTDTVTVVPIVVLPSAGPIWYSCPPSHFHQIGSAFSLYDRVANSILLPIINAESSPKPKRPIKRSARLPSPICSRRARTCSVLLLPMTVRNSFTSSSVIPAPLSSMTKRRFQASKRI